MKKINLREEKRRKNEAFADKHKRPDKQIQKKARKIKMATAFARLENQFWAIQSKAIGSAGETHRPH